MSDKHCITVPLTVQELRELHGISVEKAVRMGYCVEGHVEEYRSAHNEALRQERQALTRPGYSCRKKRELTPKHQKEESCTMDKNKRIMLLLCLMESALFNTIEPTEKAALMMELLYEEEAAPVPAKHPGGRPKKKTLPAEKPEGKE